jgi:hypothetical protein
MKTTNMTAEQKRIKKQQSTMTYEQIIALARYDLAYVAYCLKSIQRRLN